MPHTDTNISRDALHSYGMQPARKQEAVKNGTTIFHSFLFAYIFYSGVHIQVGQKQFIFLTFIFFKDLQYGGGK